MAKIAFALTHGLSYGTGDAAELQFDVTLRELTVGDVLAAQEDAEKVVYTPNGPALVMSPTRLGIHTLRRQISAIGKVQGPLSLSDMEKLHPEDLSLISRHLDGLERAMIAEIDGRGRSDAPEHA